MGDIRSRPDWSLLRTLTRGLTSLAVSALLVLAPVSTAVAFADDATAVDAPAVEVPAGETPAVEVPAAEAPAGETPPVGTPPVETPAVETPAGEAPAVETPPGETPAAETPAVEVPTGAAPTAEESLPTASLPALDAPFRTIANRAALPQYEFGPGTGSAGVYVTVAGDQMTASWNDWQYSGLIVVDMLDLTVGSYHQTNWSGASTFTTTVVPGNVYRVSIESTNPSYGMGSLQFTAPNIPAPGAPTAFTASRSAEGNAISLAWSAPTGTDNPAARYELQVFDGVDINTYLMTDPEWSVDGLTIGIFYMFAVRSISVDNQTSGWLQSNAMFAAVAPTAPTNPVLTLTAGSFTATWAAPDYDGGAAISNYRMTLYGNNVQVETTSFNATSVTFHAPAQVGVAYEVRVSAINGIVGRQLEGPITTTNVVNGPADSAPAAPTAYGHSEWYYPPMIYMSWDLAPTTGSRIISFTTILRDASGAIVREVTELNPSTVDLTGQNFLDLPNDTDYTVSVIATNAAGSSPESNRFAVRTNGPTPPPLSSADLADSTTYIPADSVTVTRDGDVLTAHVKNAAIGDWVFGYAYSSPTALGWVQVGAGNLARWNIGEAGLPAGAHTLAVLDRFGLLFGSAAFSLPAPVSAAALAVTGTDSTPWIAFGAGMLGLGALLMVRRRVRS